MEIEKRFIESDIELRKTPEGKEFIEGYGIVFNRWSQDLGGFVERIDPAAVQELKWDGVVASRNHNFDNLLGKVPKTMTLTIDDRGVKYSIEPPNNTAGNDTLESIRRGDISGSSFMFYTGEDKWTKPTKEGDPYKRTITRIDRVIEMGPVVFPAYKQTDATVAKRTLDGMIKDEEEQKTNAKLEEQKRLLNKFKFQQEQLELELKLFAKKHYLKLEENNDDN